MNNLATENVLLHTTQNGSLPGLISKYLLLEKGCITRNFGNFFTPYRGPITPIEIIS
jgi:hypothetical protein